MMRGWHAAGLVYTWAIYGAVAFLGGKAATHHTPQVVMFGLVLGRLIGGVCIAAMLRACSPPPPLSINRAAITAFLLPAVGNVGWLAYFMLARRGQLSVIMPLLSLYVLVPLVFSLAARRDRCSACRMFGVAAVLAAGVLLSVTLAAPQPHQLPRWQQGIGFVVAFLSWGASDTISSTIPRAATPLLVHVLWNVAGYALNTAIIGTALLSAGTPALPWSATANWWVAHVAINTLLPSAWVVYMALCRTHDGVVIVPLFSLYTLVAVVASIVVNGDPVTPVRGLGIGFAIAGVCALTTKAS